jgi:hypothetical protein
MGEKKKATKANGYSFLQKTSKIAQFFWGVNSPCHKTPKKTTKKKGKKPACQQKPALIFFFCASAFLLWLSASRHTPLPSFFFVAPQAVQRKK